MKILNIEYIYLMLIPSIFLLYLIVTNKSEIDRIFDNSVLKRLKVDLGLEKNLKIFLLFFALFLMIFSMSRPVIQKGIVELETKKASLVIALDISKSMLAKDYFPNRLEFAKRKILSILETRKDLEIGLIAFAKEAFIISPLTSDFEALRFLLKNLDTTYITLQGTNFLSAIEVANTLLKNKKEKNLLILTDGGDNENFEKEIDLAKQYGIKISIIGVGSLKGAPIPQNGDYLKDKNQNIVITKLNKNIADLAKKTEGIFIKATISDEDIKTFLSTIKGKKEKKIKKVTLQTELAPYFMAIALLLLSLVFFSIPGKKEFKKIFLFFLIISPIYNLNAGIFDFKDIRKAKEYYESKNYEKAIKYFKKVAENKKNAQSYYDLANAYYKAKKYKEAIKYYNMVQTPNKELERFKLHNLGNCYFNLKDFKKAIKFYEKALKIKEDPDTRYNLELAKKMLKKQKNQSGKGEKQKKDNKKSKEGKKSQNQSQQKQKKSKKKSGKKSKKETNKSKNIKKMKKEPISDREEKKWIKKLERKVPKTLIYKYPTKHKGIEVEKPW